MIDAGRITTLKIDARRGHNNVHDCKELLALLTLAESYLVLRDETSHLEFTARGVHYYTGDERSLDAAVEAARNCGIGWGCRLRP